MSKGLSSYSVIKEIEHEFECEMNAIEVPYLKEGYRKWMIKKDGKKVSVTNSYIYYLKSANKNLFSREDDFFELLKRALMKGCFGEIPELFDKYIGIINKWIENSRMEDVGIATKELSNWRSGYNNYRKFFEYIISFINKTGVNTESDIEELIKVEIPGSTNKLFLSDQFAGWMVEHGMDKRSASSYISYIKRTNKDFFCKITKNNIDPLAFDMSYLKEMPDKLMNILFVLEERLVEEINTKKYSTMPFESLFKGRAGFRQYIKFMGEIVGDYPVLNSPQTKIKEVEQNDYSN